ncbi:protein with putative role during mitosis [Irineochytrium annulatum]|nr:protein with putative role during mitosis [Irineochytrium annulatum]
MPQHGLMHGHYRSPSEDGHQHDPFSSRKPVPSISPNPTTPLPHQQHHQHHLDDRPLVAGQHRTPTPPKQPAASSPPPSLLSPRPSQRPQDGSYLASRQQQQQQQQQRARKRWFDSNQDRSEHMERVKQLVRETTAAEPAPEVLLPVQPPANHQHAQAQHAHIQEHQRHAHDHQVPRNDPRRHHLSPPLEPVHTPTHPQQQPHTPHHQRERTPPVAAAEPATPTPRIARAAEALVATPASIETPPPRAARRAAQAAQLGGARSPPADVEKPLPSPPTFPKPSPSLMHPPAPSSARVATHSRGGGGEPEGVVVSGSGSGVGDRRERMWRGKLVGLQGRVRELEDGLRDVLDVQKKDAPRLNDMVALQSVMGWCLDRGLDETVRALQKEAPTVLSSRRSPKKCSGRRREELEGMLRRREFQKAIDWIKRRMKKASGSKEPGFLQASFDDLFYVIRKYLFIDCVQRGDKTAAKDCLSVQLQPHALREAAKEIHRAEWFNNGVYKVRPAMASHMMNLTFKIADLALLSQLLYPPRSPPNAADVPNHYLTFTWHQELSNFWSSVAEPHVTGVTPLYALAMRVCCEEDDTGAQAPAADDPAAEEVVPAGQVVPLEAAIAGWARWENMRGQIEGLVTIAPVVGEEEVSAKPEEPVASPPAVAKAVTPKRTARAAEEANVAARMELPPRSGSAGAVWGGGEKFESRKLVGKRDVASAGRSEADESDRRSSGSYNSTSFNSFATSAEMEKHLPPPSKEHETADFALTSSCGPVTGQIRVIDVIDIPETGSYIAATAGSDDRADRRIWLWDVRTGKLIRHLDNGTHKPVTSLCFHPVYRNLLLSADMEFDVKLWDWQKGELVRGWKKHHTRVIWKCAFMPGNDMKGASCSGDQSLKLFHLEPPTPPPPATSIHANEPITSFTFTCPQDPSSNLLLLSLSASLRVYRPRTLSLLYTIPLPDLRAPRWGGAGGAQGTITRVEAHPVWGGRWVLVSCEQKLWICEIDGGGGDDSAGASSSGGPLGKLVRCLGSREVGEGCRLDGRWSPCGNFVYAGSWDARIGGSPARRKDGERGGDVASGVYVWRVSTGRLEKEEMRSLKQGCKGAPVTACKWYVRLHLYLRVFVDQRSY